MFKFATDYISWLLFRRHSIQVWRYHSQLQIVERQKADLATAHYKRILCRKVTY